jgi:hypothetical protein
VRVACVLVVVSTWFGTVACSSSDPGGGDAAQAVDASRDAGVGGADAVSIDADASRDAETFPDAQPAPDAVTDAGTAEDATSVDGSALECTPFPDAGRATNTVYLNFEGAEIVPGPMTNAPTNEVAFIQQRERIAPYIERDANRTQRISTIVGYVGGIFAPFDLDIVTMRPAQGPYTMIVFGGRPMQLNLPGVLAVTDTDCGDLIPSNIGFVFEEAATFPDVLAANMAIAEVGFFVGMSATPRRGDCMNFQEPALDGLCTFSETATAAMGSCLMPGALQNEPRELSAAFGCN